MPAALEQKSIEVAGKSKKNDGGKQAVTLESRVSGGVPVVALSDLSPNFRKTRDLAKADIFDYTEMFYNRTRRHSHLGGVSPEAFEAASQIGSGVS